MEFNHLDPIGDVEEEPRRPRFSNPKLRRGVYLLPSAFTIANMLCGYYAVLATLDGGVANLDNASRAIGFAILFDSVDGRIARLMGTTSSFGREFDSLADVISFGIAPAFLAYAWGVHALVASSFAFNNVHLVPLGWVSGFFFLVCCAWRLARFNIQGMAPGGNRFFVGMPTPAAAGMIAATVHLFQTPIQDPRLSILWLVLVICLGGLMSSTWRHYSFKDIEWTKRRPSLAVVLLGGLIAAIWFFSRQTLFAIAVTYTLHGVIFQVVRFARRRVASRPA
ncbi:MAG TPA: CDP-diacylglycerol--serine O-phosphatidyltransferase [Candidatus Micrarchaeaceae archaeon]|nr:CDP-diacylglycerol--serine O-phosphatidyltransferase [Candidatus Micrarchaeaceae archaeon]